MLLVEAELAAKLFGVDPEELMTALLKPRVKVGAEWVNKGQNLDQVCNPLINTGTNSFICSFTLQHSCNHLTFRILIYYYP